MFPAIVRITKGRFAAFFILPGRHIPVSRKET